MMKIAVDAMSGELGLDVVIEGVVGAINKYGADVLLVGNEKLLQERLKSYNFDPGRVNLIPSSEIITMDESPAIACKKKKDSSVMVAAQSVKEGIANGFFSPGNTGASLAAALMNCGRLKGVIRPAIACPLPNIKGHTLILDVGANVSCKPHYLVQFAIMGDVYSREIMGVSNPRIGLVSIGEEESKGNELISKVRSKLLKLPLNFIGNIEGHNLFDGSVDVAVCDGFVGNIILKATEGLAESLMRLLKISINGRKTAQIGALLLKSSLKDMKNRIDYSEYGGAPLLGVNGICIIGHGRSNSKAIMNAVRVAIESIEHNINNHITTNIKEYGS